MTSMTSPYTRRHQTSCKSAFEFAIRLVKNFHPPESFPEWKRQIIKNEDILNNWDTPEYMAITEDNICYLKTPWSDGTSSIQLNKWELMERLIALISGFYTGEIYVFLDF